MDDVSVVIDRLFALKLNITTVESCTAGLIATLLSEHPQASQLLESGLVTYSVEAKMDLLGLSSELFEQYNLTSEPVARSMALGAAGRTRANVIIAITGVLDSTAEPEIPAGTICFCWLFKTAQGEQHTFTETQCFSGDFYSRRQQAAAFALSRAVSFYEKYV